MTPPMSPARAVQQFAPLASDTNIPTALTPTAKIKELIANLEVPFHPSVIEWRVTNTSKGGSPRGQVMPYADQRAYTDRLNTLVTPAGWTRRYTIHTSATFERSKDQKIVAKVLVTCELTIFGLGSHSATGEEWADDDNAATAAEAQSFKRACSCFGLGRYLYYFTGTWVDLDDRKRPKTVPKLAAGQRLKDGAVVFVPTQKRIRSRPSEQLLERRKWRWPTQRQRFERPRRQPRSRDRADGTSTGETHVSRVVEDPSESVESEGYSGPSDPTESASAHASGRTRFPPAGCGARQSGAGTADTDTPLSEVAVARPGGQPPNLA